MSLAGNLADLSLGDILQILSLSQKSGELSVRWADHFLKLVFVEGKLRTIVPAAPEASIKNFFVAKYPGRQPFEPIASLMRSSAAGNWTQLIQLYFQDTSINPLQIGKEYVQWLVNDAFFTTQGSFRFKLVQGQDAIPDQETLLWVPWMEPGISLQYLAMEAARAEDESAFETRGSSSQEPALTKPFVHSIDPSTMRYVVVDDNPKVLESLLIELKNRELDIVQMIRSVEGFADWLQETDADFGNILFLVDLVMPKADRSGVLGGLDVLELLHSHNPAAKIVVMVDVESEQIEKKINESHAVGWVKKNSRRGFRDEPAHSAADLIGAVHKLVAELNPEDAHDQQTVQPDLSTPQDNTGSAAALGLPAERDEPEPSHEQSIFQEMVSDLAHTLDGIEMPDADENGILLSAEEGALGLLEDLLGELIDCDSVSEVVLLILRYASEVFDRGILFQVQNEKAQGAGQFGVEVGNADSRIRQLQVSVHEDSVLRSALRRRDAIVSTLSESAVNNELCRILDIDQGQTCFVGPLMAEKKVVAVLYADNKLSRQPITGAKGVQLFLRQAGLALDRVALKQAITKGTL